MTDTETFAGSPTFRWPDRIKGPRGAVHRCSNRCEWIRRMVGEVPTPTLKDIGARFGITHQRVQQLIALHGWEKARGKV